ncbi:SPOR domain-containing protein [Eubacteriales bacterium OttesenSCG-928-K08]|nr:SPOR domain-containing protein [Eubacteriales bacterium OttesenSCG-928-K08]
MEYRRKRRRRRGQAGNNGSSGIAKAVAALLVVAAIVYLISASAVGTWIAEKLIAPAFALFDGFSKTPASNPSPTPEGVNIPPSSAATNAQTITGDIEFPALECFVLQMGVYSDKSNANSQAGELQGRGAGGYVMEDEGRYRVFAAAYSAQVDLQQVREQLTGEGMESAAYTFNTPQSTLRITATQEQLSAISSGFEALSNLQNDIAAASLEFDRDQQSCAQGREKAQALIMQLDNQSADFLKISDIDHTILYETKMCIETCRAALAELAGYETESFVSFSSKMKHTHISIVAAYNSLAKVITDM